MSPVAPRTTVGASVCGATARGFRVGADLDDPGALGARVVEQRAQAAVVPLVDDRGEVAARGPLGIERAHRRVVGGDEGFDVVLRDERVVGRDADLSAVGELAEGDA